MEVAPLQKCTQDVPAPVSVKALQDAAAAYVARFPATEVTLARILNHRVDRWARHASGETDAVIKAARQAVAAVVAQFVADGALSDVAITRSKALALMRTGKSPRAVAAKLIPRGVTAETMREALNTEPDAALSAALIVARRRRIGPFRRYAPDPSVVRRELGVLARAGFARNVAVCALEMDLNEAENTLGRFRENLQG